MHVRRFSAFSPSFWLLATALLAPCAVASAQEPDGGTGSPTESPPQSPPAPSVTPPRLVTFVEAEYPPAARNAGREAAVELAITIGADGRVTDVSVVTPVGEGFDEAAVAAARQFTFEPARRDGTAMAARIRYRYVFEQRVAEPEPPPPEAPPIGRLEGRVLERDEESPIAGAEVILTSRDDDTVSQRFVTDAQGRFDAGELRAGTYALRVRAEAMRDLDAEETVTAREVTSVVYRLDLARDRESFRAVARIDPPPREVTRRTIETEELTRIPGTRGDPLRAVELLPGVGRPAFGGGLVIIRGSAPRDSEVFIEGTSSPLLYHFGGLTSVFNGRLLDRIDFFPGNFSARFGRRTGGIVDVGVRDPLTDGFHGMVDLNLIDASIVLEAPLGDRGSFALAARRSNIDFFFNNLLPEGTFGSVIAAPVYYDYQAIGTYRPTSRDKLRLLIYGSSDRFEVIFANPADQDPAVRGNLDLSTVFHRAQFEWRRQWSNTVEQATELNLGYTGLRFALGQGFKLELKGPQISARSELTVRPSQRLRLITGLDLQTSPTFSVSYLGPSLSQEEGNPGAMNDPLSTQSQVSYERSAVLVRPAVYVEGSYRITDPFTVVAGLRADYFSEIQQFTLNPRLSARYAITDQTTLKGGVGLFSQPPEFQESAVDIGNPNLRPIQSMHFGLGADHQFDETFSLGLEGFYKHIWDRVVGTPNGAAPAFVNDGLGRIYGVEIAGRAKPRGRFFGFLSYTLSRSERSDHGGPWRLFDFDQTHIFTVAAVYRLGRGWEAGLTFRYVTGNPQTPITGSIYDANVDLYRAVYGSVNSVRGGAFHRLDLRIEKKWTFQAWSLALYLDVQNVYNRRNPEGVQYSYDYQQSSVIGGLPIIPSLGIRGEI